MRIVILSTDNEDYILQWWFPHTTKYFDLGLVVDFNYRPNTTDQTEQLMKKHCQHWSYVKVGMEKVSTAQWDMVLNHFEDQVRNQFPEAWITILNPTEFIIGDTKILENIKEKTRILMPCNMMIDRKDLEDIEPDPNIPLLLQRTHGIPYERDFPHPFEGKTSQRFYEMEKEYSAKGLRLRDELDHNIRWMRGIHNFRTNYFSESNFGVGRHFWDSENYSKDIQICHMTYTPYTEKFRTRKLAIQERLTEEDHANSRGIHHRLDSDKMRKRKDFYDALAVDLSSRITLL